MAKKGKREGCLLGRPGAVGRGVLGFASRSKRDGIKCWHINSWLDQIWCAKLSLTQWFVHLQQNLLQRSSLNIHNLYNGHPCDRSCSL